MSSEINETNSARLLLYAFVRSFFDTPPTPEKHQYWRGLLDALLRGTGFQSLDHAFASLREALSHEDILKVQNEYYELFENPFGTNRLQLLASYYVDGKIMGPSLVKLRQLLYNLYLGKEEGFKETEDHLVFLVDVMMHLIGQEDVNAPVQAEILRHYLLPTFKGMAERLKATDGFGVYKAAVSVALAFLELEGCLFPSGDSA